MWDLLGKLKKFDKMGIKKKNQRKRFESSDADIDSYDTRGFISSLLTQDFKPL